MGLSVNTNTPSLIAQTSLSRAASGLERSMQRLSTGYRIGSARDDAAGLQIANRVTSQINGLTVALRNAGDSLSVTQTVEGALGEYTQILQRMRDLALQAASDSNGPSERQALDAEVSQLKAELDRIAATTSFGANKLLDGSYEDKSFQVGANSCETVSLSVPNMATEEIEAPDIGTCADAGIGALVKGWEGFTLGGVAESATRGVPPVTADALPVKQDLEFSKQHDILYTTWAAGQKPPTIFKVSVEENASARDVADAINGALDNDGSILVTAKNKARLQLYQGAVAGAADETITLNLDGSSFDYVVEATQLLDAKAALEKWVEDINTSEGFRRRGVSARLDTIRGGAKYAEMYVENTSGEDLVFSMNESAGTAGTNKHSVAASNVWGYKSDGSTLSGEKVVQAYEVSTTEYTVKGYLEFRTTGPKVSVNSKLKEADKAMTGLADEKLLTGEPGVLPLKELSVLTAEDAQKAIAVVDYAINFVDSERGRMGAMQNRVEHTVYNLQNIRQNMSASRGRLMDTDYASEVAEMTRLQILKQASIATVVQANEQARDVLQLLRW